MKVNAYKYQYQFSDIHTGDVSLNKDRSWPSSEGEAYIVNVKGADKYVRVGTVVHPKDSDGDFSRDWVWVFSQDEKGQTVVYEDSYYENREACARGLVKFWKTMEAK